MENNIYSILIDMIAKSKRCKNLGEIVSLVKHTVDRESIEIVNKWISVKDSLPTNKDNKKEFLCRCVLLDDVAEKYSYYLVLEWYVYDIKDGATIVRPHFQEDGVNMRVTHWMDFQKV